MCRVPERRVWRRGDAQPAQSRLCGDAFMPIVHHPDMHAPPPPPNASSMAERLDALRSCSLVGRVRCRSGRAKIPPACACFDTCSKAHLDHLLYRLMPTVVSSRDSPWYQYLLAIYGDALPLPFNMTRLRMLYHADDLWRTRYPQTFWPMSSCAPACGLLSAPALAR